MRKKVFISFVIAMLLGGVASTVSAGNGIVHNLCEFYFADTYPNSGGLVTIGMKDALGRPIPGATISKIDNVYLYGDKIFVMKNYYGDFWAETIDGEWRLTNRKYDYVKVLKDKNLKKWLREASPDEALLSRLRMAKDTHDKIAKVLPGVRNIIKSQQSRTRELNGAKNPMGGDMASDVFMEWAPGRLVARIGLNGLEIPVTISRTYDYTDIKRALNDEYYYNNGRQYKPSADLSKRVKSDYDNAFKNGKVSTFNGCVQHYLDYYMEEWVKKNEFETLQQYTERTTPEMLNAARSFFAAEGFNAFRSILPDVFRQEVTLGDYDLDNGTLLVRTPVGDAPVAVDANDAATVRSKWLAKELTITALTFKEVDGGISLGSVQLSYHDNYDRCYNGHPHMRYTDYSINRDKNNLAATVIKTSIGGTSERERVMTVASDVDTQIPTTGSYHPGTYVMVLANEEYADFANVPYAVNDGRIFAKYCTETLGVPKENVKIYENASLNTMRRALREMAQLTSAAGGNADVIVYYAGHGAPDPESRRPYLIPIDAYRIHAEECMAKELFYDELQRLPAHQVVAVIDACFTGDARHGDGTTLKADRGLVQECQDVTPDGSGRFVALTASGSASAYPYDKMGHGMFTYFLLKKLQESRGDASLGEIYDYLATQVPLQSANTVNSTQIPTVQPSPAIATGWRDIKLK